MYGFHSFFRTSHSRGMVPQVEHSNQANQSFVVQLRTICDSVLYAYLSKIADTAEKRHYLDLSYTAVQDSDILDSKQLDKFLSHLHKFEILDLHLSIFQPYDLRDLLVTMSPLYWLSYYLHGFRSDPERSKEFHYEGGLLHALVATRYMRFFRTFDSR